MSRRIALFLKSGRRWLVLLLAVVWVITFFLMALPRYRDALRSDRLITSYEGRLDELSGWNANAAFRAEEEDHWKTVLDSTWSEYFPPERRIETVFHQMARAATRSGVDPIVLQTPRRQIEEGDEVLTSTYYEDAYTLDLIGRMEAIRNSGPLDVTRIAPNRLRVRFESTYTQLVHFMDELAEIPRALAVSSLAVQDSPRGVSATLELEYYAQASR